MGLIFILIIAGVAFYFWMQQGKENQAKWQKAATKLGLGYYPGDVGQLGRISGVKGGHLIEINTQTRTHNKQSTTYTLYRIKYHQPIQADFRIVRQNALHKTASFLGFQDIEVGNAAFDDRALVRGMHPDRVIEFLTPARQDAIVRLIESYVNVVITNEYVELEKSKKDLDTYVLFNTTRMMLSVVNELTDNSHTLAEVEHVIEINEAPSATTILTVDNDYGDEFSSAPFVPETKVADFVEAWETDQEASAPAVEPETESVDESLPIVPEPEPEPEEVPEEPVETPAGAPVALQTVAEHLYGGGSGTMLQAGAVFQEQYENRSISGEGVLKRVGKFSYDPVFTQTEGIKASFDICTLTGPYSKIKVVADIMYPAGQYEELKARVGTSLPISGQLIAQNSTLTQLYIVAG